MAVRGTWARAVAFALLGGSALACGTVGIDDVTAAAKPRTDVTGDTFGDVVIYSHDKQSNAQVDVWPGSPNGLGALQSVFGRSLYMATGRIEVADMGGDGRADIVTVRRDPENPAVTGVGLIDGNDIKSGTPTVGTPILQIDRPYDQLGFAIGNVTGTSFGDLVALVVDASGRGELLIWEGNAPGALAAKPQVIFRDQPDFAGARLVLSDLDHDGFADVVIARPEDGERTRLERVRGGAIVGIAAPAAIGVIDGRCEDVALAGGDVDGDGHGDVVVYLRGSGDLVLLRGHSQGLWERRVTIFHDPAPMAEVKLSVSDVNGDGRGDILLARRVDTGTEVYLIEGGPEPSGTGVHLLSFDQLPERIDLG